MIGKAMSCKWCGTEVIVTELSKGIFDLECSYCWNIKGTVLENPALTLQILAEYFQQKQEEEAK